MKKFRMILAVVLAMLLLVGCGGSGKTDNGGQTNQNPPAQTQPAQTQPVQTEAPVETTEAPTEPVVHKPAINLEPVVEKSVANAYYEITQLCTITNAAFDSFAFYMPAERTTQNGVIVDYLYSYTGELLIEEGCEHYEYYGNGITMMEGDYGVHFVNVFTGERYLDDASIVAIEKLNDRFYFVEYASYGMVYDMEKCSFVANLKVADLSSSTNVVAVGNTVFEQLDYGTYRAYLDNGTVTDEIKNVYFTTEGYLCENGNTVEIYDSNCNQIGAVENVRKLSDYTATNRYSWRFFAGGEFRAYDLVDANGEMILKGPIDQIQIFGEEHMVARDDQERYALYLTDGTALTGYDYSYIYYPSELDVFKMKPVSGGECYYVPGVGVVDATGLNGTDFLTAGKDEYLIYGTGEMMTLPNASEMIHAMIVDCDLGLVDVISGNVLVQPGYDYAFASEEHLYVRNGDTWTVYALELVL